MSPSHVDTLPNELLAEIFKLDDTDHRFGMDTRLPPAVLYSHVSQRWRDVAINLPTLWTRIHIVVDSPLRWLPHYLTRSQRCHLDVWIDFCHRMEFDNRYLDDKIPDVMDLLIPHTNRWSRLYIDGWYERFAYLMLSRLANLSAPVLRKLTVYFDVEAEAEWMEENFIPFDILQGGAPLLTTIYMDMLLYCRPPLSAALTTCSIYQLDRPVACMQFIRGLAASHALTTLSVHGYAPSQNSGESAGPSLTRFESLRSLWLDKTSSFTSGLLLAISAPRLETFRLTKVESNDLSDSFHRSRVEFPTLHTLSLDTVELDDDSCIALSRMSRSITRLKVRGANPSDIRILARLIGASRQPYETDARDTSDGARVTTDIIWPKLHTIMVGNLNPDPLSLSDAIGNSLHDLVAARKALGRPIEKLVLEDKVLTMVEGMGDLRGYLELWKHPFLDES